MDSLAAYLILGSLIGGLATLAAVCYLYRAIE